MQPTSATRTFSLWPARSMAASSPAMTAFDPDERQPAAVQQRIRMAFRAPRSFSAIARRSSRSIVEPSFRTIQGELRPLIAGNLAVVDRDGGQPARPQAARGHERHLAVGGRLPGDGPEAP